MSPGSRVSVNVLPEPTRQPCPVLCATIRGIGLSGSLHSLAVSNDAPTPWCPDGASTAQVTLLVTNLLTRCLAFLRSATETLQGDDKFFCNACGTYQEATKRTRLASLPDVLLLHLNRFKYTTTQDRHVRTAVGGCQDLRLRVAATIMAYFGS